MESGIKNAGDKMCSSCILLKLFKDIGRTSGLSSDNLNQNIVCMSSLLPPNMVSIQGKSPSGASLVTQETSVDVDKYK